MRSTIFSLYDKAIRPAVYKLLVLAILFHALIPVGFMPAFAAHAGQKDVAFVICSMQSGKSSLDGTVKHHSSTPAGEQSGSHFCPYALAGAPGYAPQVQVLPNFPGLSNAFMPALKTDALSAQSPKSIHSTGPPFILC